MKGELSLIVDVVKVDPSLMCQLHIDDKVLVKREYE